jgi:hypothetical protein
MPQEVTERVVYLGEFLKEFGISIVVRLLVWCGAVQCSMKNQKEKSRSTVLLILTVGVIKIAPFADIFAYFN